MIIFYMTGMKRMQGTDFMDLSMPAERCRMPGKIFKLTIREENIILRHMFPLNVVPPMCKEAWLVCLADKICASKETVAGRIHRKRKHQK